MRSSDAGTVVPKSRWRRWRLVPPTSGRTDTPDTGGAEQYSLDRLIGLIALSSLIGL
jgi:hypothetical protein